MPALRASLLLLPLVLAAACSRTQGEAVPIQTAEVERQTVRVDVEATGVITPIAAVEVRSKASGQITALPVETGTQVKPGQLLARIDPRDPQSRFDQARAAVEAATAQVQVTRTQFERNRALLEQGVITAPELESARLAYAQAQSQLTSARTQQELARIALEDVTITAPVAGTVIARSVSLGSVISSSTNSPSGGTVLMQLADLAAVYDSALVNESDVGKLKPGQRATVTVDAYPGRVFVGMVEKIEPRATVQQSVTFFPVLIRIENEDGALMPGMNSDVSILVEERPNVVAVPADAVRQPREAATAAAALGLDPQQVQEAMRSQMQARGGARPGQGAPGADSARAGRGGRALAGGEGMGRRGRNGPGGDTGAAGPRALARGQRGGEARAGGDGNGAGAPAGMVNGRARRGGAQRGLVFVKAGETFEPRVVQLGVTNYDVTEVISGVREGEEVALMSAAVLQQQRTEFQDRIRSRSSLPGMGGGAGGGGNRGAAGGQGGGGGRGGQ